MIDRRQGFQVADVLCLRGSEFAALQEVLIESSPLCDLTNSRIL